MGRRHRRFFRICAVDSRRPRDGRVIEELGTYDPLVSEVDARALLKADRIQYWLGVGAQVSPKVKVLIKKYGAEGTHLEAQQAARERLAMPKVVPDPGAPAYIREESTSSGGDAASEPDEAAVGTDANGADEAKTARQVAKASE
jgi:small subunit ribosomal protein S16